MFWLSADLARVGGGRASFGRDVLPASWGRATCRGNPAQILGEMLTLLEADKRTPDQALELMHAKDGKRVHIPPNLHVIGTMNIADRSLALVDLALRRRFAFVELEPLLGDDWRRWVTQRCRIPETLADEVQRRFQALNERIASEQVMVAAARLALQLALPTEEAGDHQRFRPEREEAWVRQLFEHAVAGMYEAVLGPRGWKVSPGLRLDWQMGRKTSGIDALLPSMKTDIVLNAPEGGRRLVVDTKLTSIVTSGWYREVSLKSGYIHQMYAYLRSQVGGEDHRAAGAAGLLLHPAIEDEVDESVEIQGHPIRLATVDLAGSPRAIRDRVVALAEPVWPS